ncbi:Wall-associated receptor kinase 3 [Dichanthelium oligosanthes]|uniref:Wall-associated receptor kinase 3 n=1 Tax=Dichanthelium oligosanthes TaxID=888268 RepID=A0A1E5VFX3_9POAL|nr:Wall-associated receptor kinase 3 [Dichanthelium oligosanthes]
MPNNHHRSSSETLSLLAVVAPVLVLHLWRVHAAEMVVAAPPMGLPGCPTRCGNMTVPYPFGISAGCFLPGFNLTCNHKYNPPRLFLGGGATGLHVTDIFLQNASMRVMSGAIVNHTSKSIPQANGTWRYLDDDGGSGGPFVLSYHRNKLFIVGCDVQATLLRNAHLIAGCSTFCTVDAQTNRIVWGPPPIGNACYRCTGNGCCKASIPLYYPSYDVSLERLNATEVDAYPLLPKLAFIGEYSLIDEVWCQVYKWVTFTSMGIPPTQLVVVVPVLLEWAMASSPPAHPGMAADNTSRCPLDGASSACKSRYSSCIDMNSPFRSGYSCRCFPGYDGNPYLVDGCQGRSIALGVGSGGTLLVIAVSTTFLTRKFKERRKKRLRQRFFKQNRGQVLQQLVCQKADIAERMIITLEELEKATNNFDKSRELGDGGHGTVYKGILSSQHVVAIKKSKIVIQREINEFINEVAILSQVNHQNIVKLLGCCLETEVPLLVYEFISNGTLYNHLHIEAPLSISWKDRMRIAVEIARALTYLHSLVSKPIIHRDIKSPNILLDDNLTVKLSDFGASRYIPIDHDDVQTSVQGTLGYLDPMYSSTGHLTEKSDVYSFGVLLIELLTRKKPVSYRTSQGLGLVNHFISLLSEDNLVQILDPQVAKEGDGEVVDICLLAAICVKFRSEDRPTMRQVEMTLESIQASKEFSCLSTDDDDDD